MRKTRKRSKRLKTRGGLGFGDRNIFTNAVSSKKYNRTCRSMAKLAENPFLQNFYTTDIPSQNNESKAWHEIEKTVGELDMFRGKSLGDRACGESDEPMVHSNYGFYYYGKKHKIRVMQHQISKKYRDEMKKAMDNYKKKIPSNQRNLWNRRT